MKHLPNQKTEDRIKELKQFIQDNPDKRARIRAQGVLLRMEGRSRKEIAFSLKVNIDTVSNWVTFYRQNGIEGLIGKPQKGNNCKLTLAQKNNLRRIVQTYKPKQLGINASDWTLPSLKELIDKTYKIQYRSDRSYERLCKSISITKHSEQIENDYSNIIDTQNVLKEKIENAKSFLSPVISRVTSIFDRKGKNPEASN